MRRIKQILLTSFCTLLCAVFTGCSENQDIGHELEPEIKIGQVWVKEYNVKDPYKEIERDTVYIIDVNGDFVQYKRNGRIDSENKYWLPVNARLLK